MAYGQYTSLTDLSQPMDIRNLNDMLNWLFRTLQGNVGDAEVNTLTFNKLIGGILALGGVDNGNGEFTLKNAAGNVIAEGNKDGVRIMLPERSAGTLSAPLWIYDQQFLTPILLCTTQFTDGNPLEGTWYMYGNVLYFKRSDGTTEHGFTLDTMAGSVDFDGRTLAFGESAPEYQGNAVWHAGNMPITTGTWTPTFTGFSTAPTGGLYRYREIGNVCECWVRMTNNGTSNASNFYMSLPFPPANVSGMTWGSTDVVAVDNGTTQTTPGRVTVSGGGTVAVFSKDAAGGAWTNTGNKRVEFAHFTYEKA